MNLIQTKFIQIYITFSLFCPTWNIRDTELFIKVLFRKSSFTIFDADVDDLSRTKPLLPTAGYSLPLVIHQLDWVVHKLGGLEREVRLSVNVNNTENKFNTIFWTRGLLEPVVESVLPESQDNDLFLHILPWGLDHLKTLGSSCDRNVLVVLSGVLYPHVVVMVVVVVGCIMQWLAGQLQLAGHSHSSCLWLEAAPHHCMTIRLCSARQCWVYFSQVIHL